MNNSEFKSLVILAGDLFTNPQFDLNEEQLAEWEKKLAPYTKTEAEAAIRDQLAESRFIALNDVLSRIHSARKVAARRAADANRKTKAEQEAELQKLVNEAEAMEAALRALPPEEIQRWRQLVLDNEPPRRWMARFDSFRPCWIGILYARAIEGVAYVAKPNGESDRVPVEQYWESLRRQPSAAPTEILRKPPVTQPPAVPATAGSEAKKLMESAT